MTQLNLVRYIFLLWIITDWFVRLSPVEKYLVYLTSHIAGRETYYNAVNVSVSTRLCLLSEICMSIKIQYVFFGVCKSINHNTCMYVYQEIQCLYVICISIGHKLYAYWTQSYVYWPKYLFGTICMYNLYVNWYNLYVYLVHFVCMLGTIWMPVWYNLYVCRVQSVCLLGKVCMSFRYNLVIIWVQSVCLLNTICMPFG